MNAVEIILTSIGGSTLLAGALIWLTKSLISERLKNAIKHEYDQKLETHKIQLKADADLSIERLKSDLAVTAAQRNVQFARIFERTAETVAETYSRLLAFYDAVANYTSIAEWDNNPKSERRQVVATKYREFLDYYRPRRLFLPKETAKKIEDCYGKLSSTTIEFMFEVEQAERGERRDSTKKWADTAKFVAEEIPALLTLLEDDFRQILGMMQNGSQTSGVVISPVALASPVN